MSGVDIGIVVPTMGTRPEFLKQCLESIRAAGNCLVHIVIPTSATLPAAIAPSLYDKVIDDPAEGLAAAIHRGLVSFPSSVQFINWIGDDDLLTPGSLDAASAILRQDQRVQLVFGQCKYIDSENCIMFTNRSGRWALPLMRCGPQLVPQPGSLFCRAAYESIGGLNTQYKWAFDLDLLIRLSQTGKTSFIRQPLACFRWHNDSLSVGGRQGSVREASEIRKAFLPRFLRGISELWEAPLRWLIKYAGSRLSQNEKNRARSK